MLIFYIFMNKREEKIERKYFKSKIEWLAYMEKLKVFGAARRPPPSPLAPVRYMDCLIYF